MTNDPIGDYITRLRNSIMRDREFVLIPHTTILEEVSKLLKKKTIISSYEVVEDLSNKDYSKKKQLKVGLAFDIELGKKTPRITGMTRVSKPGRRVYIGYRDVPKVRNGYGVSVISTPKGLMTDSDARKSKQGGEILFNIW